MGDPDEAWNHFAFAKREISMVEVLTLEEAAQVMRCSKTHLQNVIHGRVANVPALPCVRVGRRLLIRPKALDRWLRAVEAPLQSKLQ